MATLPFAEQPFFQSLRFKVSLIAALMMLVVLLIFSGVSLISERQKAAETILENGRTFAQFSAPSFYDNYVRFYTHPQPEDFNNFKNLVQDALSANKDIKHVTMYASNGRILFDSNEFTEGKYKGGPRTSEDSETLEQLRQDVVTTRSITHENQQATQIVVPLKEADGGHIFSVSYTLLYESLDDRMAAIYQRTAIVSLLLLGVVAVVVVFLSVRLTRPIIRLTGVAGEIRAGNFNAEAPVTSNDELGRLAATINAMAQQLRALYLNLEGKVEERTQALKATEGKLLENIKQHDALLASIGDGVLATDERGNITLLNKVAEDLLQVKLANVVGKHYTAILSVETPDGEKVLAHQHPIEQVLHKGPAISTSNYYYARRENNNRTIVNFPAALSVSPVLLGGQTIGSINVFRDITHEKEVDRMKTEFISLASHQLRTPLSAIKWFSEMLLSGDAGKLSVDQTEFAMNIAQSTNRMVELVNSLLNVSRIESGRMIIEPRPTDVSELITGIINDLKGKTGEKKQTLIVSVNKEMPQINLDAHLIGQVYLNLLTNAIKYTPEGGEITVFVSRKGDELISQVSDNGYGIPKSEQNKVFQKFFRAENVTKIETDGTGLGLYLIKAIIESSGGKLWFKSEEGKGTTFWFSLPMSGMKAKAGEVTLT